MKYNFIVNAVYKNAIYISTRGSAVVKYKGSNDVVKYMLDIIMFNLYKKNHVLNLINL